MVEMSQLIEGFHEIATPISFIAILAGLIVGIVMGSIPGLTATMGLALFLPLTFFLPPLVGIPFLIGLYKGGIYGGSLPAILLRTPGTGAAVATMLDGYPLAEQGRAKSAIRIATFASVIADFISDIIVIFLAYQVAQIALMMGAPEFFAILIFSIAIIVTATSDNVSKSLMSGSLGLMIALIGTDAGGRWRFAFGSADMSGGIDFVSALIGLFAFSIVIERLIETLTSPSMDEAAARERKKLDEIIASMKHDKLTWKEFLFTLPAILRATFAGAFLGLVPAIGQPVATFLGYSLGRRYSKKPEDFGKGSLEGVAAAEAGNNSVNGPSLIPLFAFGIPGDLQTAVLFGAFMVHGISPGPGMFQQHGETVYGILIGMAFTCILLLGVGLLFAEFYSKIAIIPSKVIMPLIFGMAIVGSYAVNNSMFDVLIMIIFGFMGVLFKRYGFPLIPMVITFMLGHNLETSLIQSLILFRGNPIHFFTNPICVILFILAIVILFSPTIKQLNKLRKKKREA